MKITYFLVIFFSLLFVLSLNHVSAGGKIGKLSDNILTVPLDQFTRDVPETADFLSDNEEAIKTDPQNIEAWVKIGKYHLKNESWSDAEISFEQALAIQSSRQDAWEGYLLSIAAQKNGELLLEKSEQAISVLKSSPIGYLFKGLAQFSLGRYQEAITTFERGNQMEQSLGFLSNIGICYNALGDHKGAIDSYDRALLLDPGNSQVLYNKGNALYKDTQYTEALNAYQESLAQDPSNINAMIAAGRALTTLGRYDEALKLINQVIEIAPDDPLIWNAKAIALCGLGKNSEALDAVDQAIMIDANNSDFHLTKKVILNALGKKPKASIY